MQIVKLMNDIIRAIAGVISKLLLIFNPITMALKLDIIKLKCIQYNMTGFYKTK